MSWPLGGGGRATNAVGGKRSETMHSYLTGFFTNPGRARITLGIGGFRAAVLPSPGAEPGEEKS
jgi:hypothetical protein